jgi:hypothetical protein
MRVQLNIEVTDLQLRGARHTRLILAGQKKRSLSTTLAEMKIIRRYLSHSAQREVRFELELGRELLPGRAAD